MREATILRPLFVALVFAISAIASFRLWVILRVDGLTALELVLWASFTVLFAWIATGFWLYCLGAYARLFPPKRNRPSLLQSELPTQPTRTAILMPIYNEATDRVFAGISAMLQSLRATGTQEMFDFYILSDSTKPGLWIAEEIAWMQLKQQTGARVYYRHRVSNTGRKPGNIADFCKNWGSLYDYMVVLDADSLMTGETFVGLARMMDANPNTALIQVPPLLIGGSSLFSVIQQFASRVYGPVCAAGFAMLHGAGGNYWGHNAIIRVQAFVDNCGLPTLPGTAPLGGEILSHDFVEAALLRKAGWDLWLAPELGGSYEETPSGVIDYLERDRRWCQGNLQHTRLLFAQGFKWSSRLHLAFGIMSYLASPLWLLLLFVSILETRQHAFVPAVYYYGRYPILTLAVPQTSQIITLVAAAVVLLFGPKLIALLSVLRDPGARLGFGGARGLVWGVVLESVFSALYSPIAMLSHSWFVLNILLGRGISWTPPPRGDSRPRLATVARRFAPHTLVALVVALITWQWRALTFWWLLPLWVGPLFSIALVKIVSEPLIGNKAYRAGHFRVPQDDMAIVRQLEEILVQQANHAPNTLDQETLVRVCFTEPLTLGLRRAMGGQFATA